MFAKPQKFYIATPLKNFLTAVSTSTLDVCSPDLLKIPYSPAKPAYNNSIPTLTYYILFQLIFNGARKLVFIFVLKIKNFNSLITFSLAEEHPHAFNFISDPIFFSFHTYSCCCLGCTQLTFIHATCFHFLVAIDNKVVQT